MKFRAVIFDLFGTLVRNLNRQEFERMLSEMAGVLSVSSGDFVRLWNDTWDKRRIGLFPTLEADIVNICRILDVRPQDDQVSKAAEMRMAFARQILAKPREDARQTLAVLKESGYNTGLISNCAADIPRVWPGTPLAALIDVPIFSCSEGFKKPDLQVYILASKRLKVPPEKCVYLGDGNENELTGASEARMRSLLFRGPDEDPYDEGRDRKEWRGPAVSSLGEIPKFLDRV